MLWSDLTLAKKVMGEWNNVNHVLDALDMLPGTDVEVRVRRECYPDEASTPFIFPQSAIKPLLLARKAEIKARLDELGVKPS